MQVGTGGMQILQIEFLETNFVCSEPGQLDTLDYDETGVDIVEALELGGPLLLPDQVFNDTKTT